MTTKFKEAKQTCMLEGCCGNEHYICSNNQCNSHICKKYFDSISGKPTVLTPPFHLDDDEINEPASNNEYGKEDEDKDPSLPPSGGDNESAEDDIFWYIQEKVILELTIEMQIDIKPSLINHSQNKHHKLIIWSISLKISYIYIISTNRVLLLYIHFF